MIGVFGVGVHAADDQYVQQTYVGQPTDTASKYYDSALYIKVNVVGYKGKKLRIRIKSSDGTELSSVKLDNASSNNTYYHYYWTGKDSSGNFYKDGTYTIQTWIYGDDSTLVTKSYNLDLKGNDSGTPTAVKKSAKVTYMGQPKDPKSSFYNRAMLVQTQIKGYKDKTAVIEIYDPSGRYVKTFEFLIKTNDYAYNSYWTGYDYDGIFCDDGTYTARLYVYGYESATEQDWTQKVTLKKTDAKFMKFTGLTKDDDNRLTAKFSTAGHKGETVVTGFYDFYGTYHSLNTWTLKTNDVEYWKLYIGELLTYGTTGLTIKVISYIDGQYDSTVVVRQYKVS
jgi:flagellar hook assembly protein FlgD